MNTDKNGMNTDYEKSAHAGTTGEILNAAFEVANVLGNGFLEAVYRRALVRELKDRNLLVDEEVPFRVRYKGSDVGVYIADVVVAQQVLVELKCAESLVAAHSAQVLNYLRASGLPVGLLINFGTPKVTYRRLVL
jgi:GxxExxY protein